MATIAGNATVNEGATYTLTLSSSDPTTSQWTISWGDGPPEVFAGNPSTVTHTYADGLNNYVISATVTTSTGTTPASNTVAVTVNNLNPTLTVDNAAVTVNEGQTATNSGTFGDVPADTVSLAASLGIVTGTAVRWSWSYATTDNAPLQSVTITATDEDGGLTTVSFDLTVNNLNPTLTVDNAAVTVNEGQTATNSGTFGDVPADTVSLAASIGIVTGTAGAWSWSYATTDNAPLQSVTITATDEDGGLTTVSFNLTVNNLNPTLTVDNGAVTVNEGQTATNSGTFGDVPADTVSLAASLGIVTGTAGAWSWSYATTDNAPLQSVTITATDEDGGLSTVSFNLTVNNLNPTLTVDNAAVTVNEGQTATNSGTFGDVPADTVSLAASLGIVTGTAGAWSWSYATTDNAPLQSVTITATDEDGGLTTVMFDLTVNNLDPVITSIVVNPATACGTLVNQSLTLSAAFDDVGVLDTHTATIDWGDGNITSGSVDQMAGTVSASHAYTSAGYFTVTLTVTDDDTGAATQTATTVISGLIVDGGILQVIGTECDDEVEVLKVSSSTLKVIYELGSARSSSRRSPLPRSAKSTCTCLAAMTSALSHKTLPCQRRCSAAMASIRSLAATDTTACLAATVVTC